MIEISRCTCGHISLPPEIICPECRKKMVREKVDGEGNVLSTTVLYSTAAGFQSPVYLAIVSLDIGCALICRAEAELHEGARVRVELSGNFYSIRMNAP